MKKDNVHHGAVLFPLIGAYKKRVQTYMFKVMQSLAAWNETVGWSDEGDGAPVKHGCFCVDNIIVHKLHVMSL